MSENPPLAQWEIAAAETERLSRELDITNADHIALWLEGNALGSTFAWLAVRIVEAHEAALRAFAANPPKHRYWRAGDPGCPRELKVGNGELHTLRCKVCGNEDARSAVCFPAPTDLEKDNAHE